MKIDTLLPLSALIAFSLTSMGTLKAQGGGPPVNDHCEDVTPASLAIDSSVVFTGTTVGATVDGDYVPGSELDQFQIAVVWVAYTTTACADVTVSFCGSPNPFGSQYFWEAMTPQCPGDQLVISSDYNTSECSDGNPTIHFYDVPPGTYYYPVWAQQTDPIGDYVITVSANACAGGNAPANDVCSGADTHALSIGDTLSITGDNTGATDSEGLGFDNVWESFTLDQCANVTLDYCGSAPQISAFAHGLYSDCPATTFIDTTAAGTCADGSLSESFEGLAPGTYWIPVLMQPDSAMGAYTIGLTATACAIVPTSNDTCGGAMLHVLSVGDTLTITGDNSVATDSEGLGYANVWESFTLDQCANITLAYCGSAPQLSAFAHGLYSDCPATTFIDTTAAGTCADGSLSESFEGLAPGTYWIPVLMQPDSAIGAYTIGLTAMACAIVPPSNDSCGGAMLHALSVGDTLTITGNNSVATDGEGIGYANVWESFTLDQCANVTLAYCGSAPQISAFAHGLYSDCPATTFIDTTAAGTCADGSLSESFEGLAPGTYWIPVLMQPDSAIGAYTIGLSAMACAVLPPANDSCGGAALVPVVAPANCDNGAVEGDNTGATFTGSQPACGDSTTAQDVWFTFNSGVHAQVTILLASGTIAGVGMEVLSDCSSDSSLFCTTDSMSIDMAVEPGTDYLVRVFNQGAGSVPGTFTLCVTADIGTGVKENGDRSFGLFPNPTTGDVSIRFDGATGPGVLTVTDLTGRTVYSGVMQLVHGGTSQLSLAGVLAPGIYTLGIATADGRSSARLMVR